MPKWVILKSTISVCVRVAQLDRAFGYGPKGRGFESYHARYKSCKADICYAAFFLSFLNYLSFLTLSSTVCQFVV